MKAIIIGAGRGSRLRHLTEEIPKTLVPILGRPMLDAILEARAAGGLRPPNVVFVCGYLAETIRARYPALTYVENTEWERNNILASLLYARDEMAGGFVSTPVRHADMPRASHPERKVSGKGVNSHR